MLGSVQIDRKQFRGGFGVISSSGDFRFSVSRPFATLETDKGNERFIVNTIFKKKFILEISLVQKVKWVWLPLPYVVLFLRDVRENDVAYFFSPMNIFGFKRYLFAHFCNVEISWVSWK